MFASPGTPVTAATRPPPTAGPRFRNFTFSSQSFGLFRSAGVLGSLVLASFVAVCALLLGRTSLLPGREGCVLSAAGIVPCAKAQMLNRTIAKAHVRARRSMDWDVIVHS